MDTLLALERLSEQEKDALIVALWAEVQRLQTRVAELEARLRVPGKDARHSSVPPSHTQGQHSPTPTHSDASRGQRRSGWWWGGPCTPTRTR
jgi:hypothetical protein